MLNRSPLEDAKLEIRRLKHGATQLSLTQCGLHDEDIGALKDTLRQLTQITSLDLSHSALGKNSVSHLLEVMPQLIELNLGSTYMEDDAITEILKFKHLQKVYLHSTGLTEKGALQLLEHCHCTEIYVSGPYIDIEMEAKIAALAEYNQQQSLKKQFGIKNGEQLARNKFIEDHWEHHREELKIQKEIAAEFSYTFK